MRRDQREERSVRTGYMSTAARGATPHGARRRRSLPALGLDVVHMGVLPGLDGSDDLADVDAILDDGVADIHILESDLVSQRNVLNAGQGDRAILVEDQAGQRLSSLNALDNDDGDRILGIVKNTVNHALLSCPIGHLPIKAWYRGASAPGNRGGATRPG